MVLGTATTVWADNGAWSNQLPTQRIRDIAHVPQPFGPDSDAHFLEHPPSVVGLLAHRLSLDCGRPTCDRLEAYGPRSVIRPAVQPGFCRPRRLSRLHRVLPHGLAYPWRPEATVRRQGMPGAAARPITNQLTGDLSLTVASGVKLSSEPRLQWQTLGIVPALVQAGDLPGWVPCSALRNS